MLRKYSNFFFYRLIANVLQQQVLFQVNTALSGLVQILTRLSCACNTTSTPSVHLPLPSVCFSDILSANIGKVFISPGNNSGDGVQGIGTVDVCNSCAGNSEWPSVNISQVIKN